jgi:DNA-binding response OmpR family regulator
MPRILIVTSRFADDYLWSEVLNFGGYDVLSKPFSEEEVRHVFASVWAVITGPVRAHAAGFSG